MPYGGVKFDTITFTNAGADTTTTISGLYAANLALSTGLTVTGTISGITVVSTTGTFTSLTGTTATFTSGIIASGTVALPSLAILSDPNTGIFSPGADQLAVATNGTRRLLIDSAGALTLDTGDATIYGVRVGRGGGAIATNTAIGASALSSNISGVSNTAIGNNALRVNTANLNTAVGDSALYSCTTGNTNVAVGPYALYSNVTGNQNVAIGISALYANTATGNIAIGYLALSATTSGAHNIGIGNNVLISNTTGTLNTVIGARNAAYDNTTGSNNVVLGDLALRLNTTGSSNVVLGVNSLYANTTGSANICLGYQAGNALTTGSNNTIIGAIAGTAGLADTVIIGAGSTERLRIDSGGVTSITAGLKFPATAVASADPNTLDDYEEGTFTPTVVGTTLAGTATYTTQVGSYTKIGRLVQVQFFTVYSGHTGTGNITITGLPFTSQNRTSDLAFTSPYHSDLALTAGNVLMALVDQNSTTVWFYQVPTGGGAAVNVPMDAAASIGITVSYTI